MRAINAVSWFLALGDRIEQSVDPFDRLGGETEGGIKLRIGLPAGDQFGDAAVSGGTHDRPEDREPEQQEREVLQEEGGAEELDEAEEDGAVEMFDVELECGFENRLDEWEPEQRADGEGGSG